MRHAATLALGVSPVATYGALQMFGTAAAPHWSAIGEDFMSLPFWVTIFVVLVAGAFGGISYELLLRKGAIELPHRVQVETEGRTYTHAPPETLIALGIVGRALVGSAAAVSVLMVAKPDTAQEALALSVTAGAAAPALIRLMRKQLLIAANVLDRLNAGSQREPKSRPAQVPAPVAQQA